MKILTHQRFDKRFVKLREGERRRFFKRRDLFLQDQFDPRLKNHPLHGRYVGWRGIHIGGDLSVIYRLVDADTAYFLAIGTHSELYGS
ncbi:MAG: hypothetical protein COV91_01835 [Candidatus Taylorbacteria bacterium CG11_big_fil_rev_8_21_14_0_20_46_11]|uniref:Type II toxin-antitoxin system mRNA interferase toxin, RelE/StbE family n=1 Tax=Candidatus Taylorbacteria bacterium CG11_big_fil_rev_8_21_14_0_20_46_11 TaxID=1975025 RepID=A0A2H0KCA9_9BACT|nr:MAG: hypothetical protein COV91_01835 [Candidatus Taylorbacteria bacterium CG11_big_fil_rev_8_21_14_0_20_46_11]